MPNPADDIRALYQRHAAAFIRDRAQSPQWFERSWFERFAGLVAPGGHILDLGCGPGVPVAEFLIGRGFSVTGVDSSPSLLAHARATLPSAQWIMADMRTLDHGRTFDGILAWDSFFHLAHDPQRAMFPIFAAHATPGAILMFNTGPDHGIAMGDYEGDPLYHASLSTAEYQTLLTAHGFEILDHAVKSAAAGDRTVWLAQKAKDHDAE